MTAEATMRSAAMPLSLGLFLLAIILILPL
jgi:hypothetical protein